MVTFDTLKASRRLRDAGFEEEKAEALVNAFAEDIGANLATKDDVALLRKDLTNRIEALRQDMVSGDEALRKDVTSQIEALRSETASDIAALRKDVASDIAALRKDVASDIAAMRKDMANALAQLEQRMTIRLGGMIVGGVAAILAAIGIATGVLVALL